MSAHVFSLAATGTALALSVCSPRSGRNTAAGSSAPAADDDKGIRLLNVSCDITRDFYKEYNPLFAEEYRTKHNNETVDIQQSHGGSSKQTLSVAGGLATDVVTMNQTSDIELLEQKGLIKPGWTKRLPDNAMPYANTTVFLVRKGNPRQIKDWSNSTKNDVQIVIANPKTTNNGHYAFLGAYGYGLRANNGDENKAKEFATALLKNVPIFENGSRAATTTFNQRNIGDVLITFENETNHVDKKLAPNQFEVVYPSYITLSESLVTAIDGVVEKRDTRVAVEEYLQYLWNKSTQELATKLYLRPRDAEVLAAHKADFPEIETFSSDEKFGPWGDIIKKYFPGDGLINQLSPKE